MISIPNLDVSERHAELIIGFTEMVNGLAYLKAGLDGELSGRAWALRPEPPEEREGGGFILALSSSKAGLDFPPFVSVSI
jgi:hypothetical protein